VPFAAGGPADLVARLLGAELAELTGQACVVENLSGAGGVTGTEAAVRAAADGHTLLLGSSSTLILNPLLHPGRADPVGGLTPIRLLARMPLAVVTAPDGPATLGALVERIRAAPGRVSYGSAGVGSISHLAGALLAKEAGAEVIHVPYRGSAPAVQAVLAREVTFFLDALSGVRQQVLDGALRGLAITAPERSRFVPEVPSAPEVGMARLEAFTWYGVLAPRATPEGVLEAIAVRTGGAAARLSGSTRASAVGLEVLGGSGPTAFAEYIRLERSLWEPLVRSLALPS
jgi:tripartite-type tricarboxylate transporter receptor subunit TctC